MVGGLHYRPGEDIVFTVDFKSELKTVDPATYTYKLVTEPVLWAPAGRPRVKVPRMEWTTTSMFVVDVMKVLTVRIPALDATPWHDIPQRALLYATSPDGITWVVTELLISVE